MDASAPDLDRLDEKIRKLKREYELFLAGQRRSEPAALASELDRELVRLTRYPFPSTALRFRLGTLAHRFQAVLAQIRKLLEQRESRKRETARGAEPAGVEPGAPAVTVDAAALERPELLQEALRQLHRGLAARSEGRPVPPLDVLEARLLGEARRLVNVVRGVRAVRFTLSEGEGGARLRGEVIREEEG